MFPDTDTKDSAAVAAVACEVMGELFPGHGERVLRTLFRDSKDMFEGRFLDYQAIDIRYHDFEHTLQATLCMIRLFEGRAMVGAEPRLSARDFELCLASALLHDTGYLRLRSDRGGSSAKYTHCHVLRSGAFAASYLPSVGFNGEECDRVTSAIHSTGRYPWATHLHFSCPSARLISCMLVTADYLGQMSAPDYPNELELLYAELRESDEFYHIPDEERSFANEEELLQGTPGFWHRNIRGKLETEFDAVYRFLSRPCPDGPNAYLEAVERNIASIGLRLSRK
jgi:hypothetical protein